MNRKLSLYFSFLLALSLVVLLPIGMRAQKQTPSSNKQTAAALDKEKKAEEERVEAERRSLATSLLLDVAEESSKFRDLILRARVQARAADTLWEADQDRARVLFRKAWDSAGTADKEAMRRFNEEVRASMKERGNWSGVSPRLTREEVLRLVAKRDRNLGEEFLKKLEESQKADAEKDADDVKEDERSAFENPNDPYELTPAQKQRIRVATSLLESDVERAVQFADPALFRVSMETLSFLCSLRVKNATLADQRYSTMLAGASANPTSDANAVSFLSSYIFTPYQFIRYGKEGSISSNNFGQGTNTPFDNDELRLAFIRFAQQVLLRPVQQQEQPGLTTGSWGAFKTIERLLPYLERYAAPEIATAFRAQLGVLRPGQQQQTQAQDEDVFFQRNSTQDAGKDFVQLALERADRAKTQEERDNIYFTAALSAVHRNDPRARDLLDKIEDSEMRNQLRPFIDYIFISKAIEELKSQSQKKDEADKSKASQPKEQKKVEEKKKLVTVDEALQLIRRGEVTNLQRVWALTEMARLLTKSDKEKANDLLEEAGAEAGRISNSNPERPQAFVGVASAFLEINRQRGWEFVSEALRAANSCEAYKGEDARMTVRVQTKSMTSVTTNSLENFDLPNLFKTLAKDDLNRAISQARSFGYESPRSTAIITISQTILQKKEEDKKQKVESSKQ